MITNEKMRRLALYGAYAQKEYGTEGVDNAEFLKQGVQ